MKKILFFLLACTSVWTSAQNQRFFYDYKVSPQPTASLRIKECVGFLQKKSMQNWQEEILEFQNSGESAVQFCKKRGLKISTFRYHLKKQQVSSGFLEILPSQSGVRFEVQYPNGVRLLIHGEISHSQLKGFLDV